MIAVSAVDGHAFKTVAVVRAGLTARAMVARLAHLPQKFLLYAPSLFLFALPVELILQNGQFISINLHIGFRFLSCCLR